MGSKVKNWFKLTGEERLVMTVALLTLPCLRLALKVWSYQTVNRWVGEHWPRWGWLRGSQSLTPAHIGALIHTAADHGLITANCLPRSLLLYHWLAQQNHAVTLQFGVNQTDNGFEAHAWVEFEGDPLAESGNPRDRFVPLPRLD